MRRGFSIVELVVVMTIMAILLALGIFGSLRAQVNARDSERAADVAAIARGLEERYKLGNTRATEIHGFTNPGQYPGNNEFVHIIGMDKGSDWSPSQVVGGYGPLVLPGTTDASFLSPSGQGWAWSCVWDCSTYNTSDPQFMTDYILPSANNDQYVYVPTDPSGTICCCNDCKRFEIYYKRESDGQLIKVTSEHQ